MEMKLDILQESESSKQFHQGMISRMDMSYYKYGPVREGYPHRVNAIESLKLRLKKYEDTGNTEFLMDVANFAMIEFMFPKHPKAYFKPTDSSESPGRIFFNEIDPSKSNNKLEE